MNTDPRPGDAPDRTDWPDHLDQVERRHRRRGRITFGVAVLAAVALGTAGWALGTRQAGVRLSAADETGAPSSSTTPPDPKQPSSPAVDSGDVVKYALSAKGAKQAPTPIIARNTRDGLGLRVNLTVYGSDAEIRDDIPVECRAVGLLSIGVLDRQAVVRARAPLPGSTTPRAVFAAPEDSSLLFLPVMLVVVTGAGSSEVRAEFPGGGTDSMEARGGVAVLAAEVPGTASAAWDEIKVSLRRDGSTTQLPVSNPDLAYRAAGTLATGLPAPSSRECAYSVSNLTPTSAPPPTAPPPAPTTTTPPVAGPQPANPSAAKEKVIKAFKTVWGSTTPAEQRAAFIDDPTGTGPPLARLFWTDKPPPREVGWTFRDLVFTSPATAVARYDFIPPDPWSSRVLLDVAGEAHLVGGVWKVAGASVCQNLTLFNSHCEPPGS